MAKLCIRIQPNNHPTDSDKDILRTQPGDVVDICEDNHQWSFAELNCGQYRFIDLPGVPSEQLAHLKNPAYDADGKMIAKRAVTLDKNILVADFKNKTILSKEQVGSIIITKV